jgi:Ca2+/Na+ antiporter
MSLPDILGACMVTRAETHADEAMIHIAGSIAVKVLMGVGLPWFIAALYHYLHVIFFSFLCIFLVSTKIKFLFYYCLFFRKICLSFRQMVLVLMFFYTLS